MPIAPAEIPILIPALQPGEDLVRLVEELVCSGAAAVIVVDDGSGPAYAALFEDLARSAGVHLVRHAVQLGRGAAVKSGLNYALLHFPACAGVVTTEAGHAAADIMRVASALRENPKSIVLGIHPASPRLRRRVLRFFAGLSLDAAQSALRGLPASLVPRLLRLPALGDEFQLDTLLAARLERYPVVHLPLTAPRPGGGARFLPLLDSMRIYFLLLRFGVLSLLTAAFDNLIFILAWGAGASIAQAQVASRSVAMIFNYLGARSAVFQSHQSHAAALPRYVLLVAANGFLAYALIQFLVTYAGLPAIPAKLLAEGLLFSASFALQRDFIFSRGDAAAATDWESYYRAVPPTARLTRRITTAVLLRAIRRHAAPAAGDGLACVELGGANSCFLDAILAAVPCRSYDIVDTSRYGLSLLEPRLGPASVLRLHERSVFSHRLDSRADLVFSAGLVEHFDASHTREAVLAHFDALRPGGVAILTFPTPTWLYRAARRALESLGLWRFPDERPLPPSEIIATLTGRAALLESRTLWPLVLTQQIVVARKHAAADGDGAQSGLDAAR